MNQQKTQEQRSTQKQPQELQHPQLLQQLQQQKRRSTANNKISKASANRKRSHSSSSSTSSSESPPNNLFSTANSSDSGFSSITSVKSGLIKKKRTGNGTDSSSAESSSSSSQLPALSSLSTTLNSPSSAIPPRLTAQRSVPAFLNKLYNMVEDLSTSDLIRWSKDGTSFIVERHEEFAKTVLPRFYKHNTFASFVRQLNMYDFHKVPHLQQGVLIAETDHEIWEFSNPHFQRSRPDLLVLVTRKRNRDRDVADTENVSIASLVQDIATIKKYQSNIGNELKDLHRDNEILWQETLNAREKYQRHQESIEKVLQFLTAIFTNDHLAISMNNADSVPKGLIEEAASLAGMTAKLTVNNNEENKMDTAVPLTTSHSSSSLSNILSSVLKLYTSNNSPSKATDAVDNNQSSSGRDTDNNGNRSNITDSFQYTQSPTQIQHDQKNETGDASHPTVIDFSKTLNTATRSAQNITQDIDMLQVNIESLANNLGIDPSQFDEDVENEHCFQDGYSNMINSVNSTDRAKLYAIADSNADMDNKKNYVDCYDTKKKQAKNGMRSTANNTTQMSPSAGGSSQFTFNLKNPPRGIYPIQNNIQQQKRSSSKNSTSQLQAQQRPQFQQQRPSFNTQFNSTITNCNTATNEQAPQQHPPSGPQPLNPPDDTFHDLLSMNYSDSFGSNYPSSSTDVTTDYSSNQQSSGNDSSGSLHYEDNNNVQHQQSNHHRHPPNTKINMNTRADSMADYFHRQASSMDDNELSAARAAVHENNAYMLNSNGYDMMMTSFYTGSDTYDDAS